MIVVVNDFPCGSVVLYWEASAAPTDFQQLLAQARTTGATHAGKALAQRANYCCGQGFTSGFGDLACQTIRFGVFNA